MIWSLFIKYFLLDHNKTVFGQFTKINAVFQLRNVRTLELMTELTDFKIIMTTIDNLSTPIISKLVFLFIVFYLYAMIGAKMFGG